MNKKTARKRGGVGLKVYADGGLGGGFGLEAGAEAAFAPGGLIFMDDATLGGFVDDGDALGESDLGVFFGAVGDFFEELFHRITHVAQAPAVAGAAFFVLTDSFA